MKNFAGMYSVSLWGGESVLSHSSQDSLELSWLLLVEFKVALLSIGSRTRAGLGG